MICQALLTLLTLLPQQAEEKPAAENPAPAKSPESQFKLAEWREKPAAQLKERVIKIGEILDYIENHYAPGLNREVDSAYGYFQINSPDFDRWTDDYIDLQLLTPLAASKDLVVSRADVEAEAKLRAEQEQKRYIDKKQLDPSSAKAALPGLISRTLRNQGLSIEKQLLIAKLFARPIAGAELRPYFTLNAHRFGGVVQASQILFSTNDPQTGKRYPLAQRESLRQSANDLLKKLREGSDFTEAVKLHSDDAASKKKGGDMGFFRRNSTQLPEALTRAAYVGIPGDILLVETEQGFHLLKIVERRVTKHPEFTQIRDEVETDFIREKSGKLIEELRRAAGLTIY